MGANLFATAALLVVGTVACAGGGTAQRSPLGLRLAPTHQASGRERLTEALGRVGAGVEGGYVLFSVELRAADGREPIVDLDLPSGGTLGDALRRVMAQLQGYRLEVVSQHLIEIYPAGAKEDPSDLLNLRVGQFDVVNGDPDLLLSDPQMFIPELRARLQPHPPPTQVGSVLTRADPGTRKISLHLRDRTVRQVLESVSEGTERPPSEYPSLSWVCVIQPDPVAATGARYTWGPFLSGPGGRGE